MGPIFRYNRSREKTSNAGLSALFIIPRHKMKFSAVQSLALTFASYASADFYIVTGTYIDHGYYQSFSVACPTNYYNCNCILELDSLRASSDAPTDTADSILVEELRKERD
ncbi:hypothetical protein V8C35DRAFT_308735 [Trichoderma chlorosporum]